ncbi:hypothetical protein SCA6_018112 [Theobroma cacao]
MTSGGGPPHSRTTRNRPDWTVCDLIKPHRVNQQVPFSPNPAFPLPLSLISQVYEEEVRA